MNKLLFAGTKSIHLRRRLALLAAALVAIHFSLPLQAANKPTGPTHSGVSLESFPDTEPKGVEDKLAQIDQTLSAEEQKTIDLQFEFENACCVRMRFVNYPSGNELIPGYLFTSAQMNRAERHPAVIVVHGAFHGHFDTEFFPLIRGLVDRGYVVMFPEYRGSAGYGPQIYANDYGSTDVADVLAAARYLTARPFVDPARLGIFGRSRGGMIVLLAIEQAPKTFKVAVDVVGLTDFVAFMAYKPEHTRKEVASEPGFGGKMPFENLQAYIRASPINYVNRIETPLLVLATSGDRTAPLALHSGRLIDLLKTYHKVFASKVYHDAPGGHIFMEGDSPAAADAYRRTYEWLTTHLK